MAVEVEGHRRGRMSEHRLPPFTDAPEAIASDAAVCRSSCGTSPSMPTVRAARSNQRRRKSFTRSTPPRGAANTNADP
jgi:hypothetical protein